MIKWLRRKLITLLGEYLPSKGKRIIYILMCYIVWSKTEDVNQIRNELIEISNRLHLVNDTHALDFAIALKDVLFEVEEFKRLNQIPPDHDMKRNIMRCMPSWLRYDTDDHIRDDLQYVFKDRYLHANS